MARLADRTEVEFKLTVVGDDTDGVLDRVAGLDRLGNDVLGPVRSLRLRDLYWDTEKNGLREHGLTLRVRRSGGAAYFTVKGGSSSIDGLFRRHELELPATTESWVSIRSVLAEHGVALAGGDATPDRPEQWLVSAGLLVTQDRATERRARDLLRDDVTCAELALDCTTFQLHSLEVTYREIEVEQVGDMRVDLAEIGRALSAMFPGRLEPSTMGKYSRGLALERQLRAADLL